MTVQMQLDRRAQVWRTVFPNTENLCRKEIESRLFIKRLTGIALSTVLYLRKALPRDNFEKILFDDLHVRVLKSANRYHKNHLIGTWMSGAFEAMDNQYLKSMILEVKDEQTGLNLESYLFSFSYTDEEDVLSLSLSPYDDNMDTHKPKVTLPMIQSSTSELIQACYALTAAREPLPPSVVVTMRLLYHEHTPVDFQPAGFEECSDDVPNFGRQISRIALGRVQTNHHTLKVVRLTAEDEEENPEPMEEELTLPKRKLFCDPELNCLEDEPVEEERNIESPKTPVQVLETQESTSKVRFDLPSQKRAVSKRLRLDQDVPKENCSPSSSSSSAQVVPSTRRKKQSQSQLAESEDVFSENILSEDRVRCVCLSEIKASVLFQCSSCRYWFHAECYGFQDTIDLQSFRGSEFFCVQCHCSTRKSRRICHDDTLLVLNDDGRQKRAILRRSLNHCNRSTTTEISAKTIKSITGLDNLSLIEGVLNELVTLKVICRGKNEKKYTVRKRKLKEILPTFFYPNTSQLYSTLPMN